MSPHLVVTSFPTNRQVDSMHGHGDISEIAFFRDFSCYIVGWCEEGHRATKKLASTFERDRQLPSNMVTKRDFLEMDASL